MYNNYAIKKMDFFPIVHISIKDKYHQMSLSRYTNHLIPSSNVWFMETFSFSIFIWNVNNNFKGSHMLQR
jgi:hypothetical protein